VKAIAASGGRQRRRSQSITQRARGFSLVAAVMLIFALSPSFVSQVCTGCVGISATLGESTDAWAVVWIASVLAVTAVFVLAGVAARLMAMVNAVAALAASGLAVFEGLVAFPHVLAAAELVPGGVVHALGPGYYVLLMAGVLAVGSAAAMLLAHTDRERLTRSSASVPRWGIAAAGGASLCVLALAAAGAFLPFATLSCGFGCPPDQPASASYAGALAGSGAGRIVLGLLVAAALATALRVAGRGKALASIAALFLALAATVLVSLDSLNAATQILGWPYGIPAVPVAGYYVLQIGTAACVVLSMLLVTADHPTGGLFRRSGLGVRSAAGSA
jgi:hypothetical protein